MVTHSVWIASQLQVYLWLSVRQTLLQAESVQRSSGFLAYGVIDLWPIREKRDWKKFALSFPWRDYPMIWLLHMVSLWGNSTRSLVLFDSSRASFGHVCFDLSFSASLPFSYIHSRSPGSLPSKVLACNMHQTIFPTKLRLRWWMMLIKHLLETRQCAECFTGYNMNKSCRLSS